MDSIRRVDLQKGPLTGQAGSAGWGQELRIGLEEHGFVKVVGHEVSADLVSRAQDAFRRFFELPEHAKNLCGGVSGGQRGFTPLGLEHARDQHAPDQKEFFHVGQADPPPAPKPGTYPGNVWPGSVPDLQDAALDLYSRLEETAGILLQGLARACEIPTETFSGMIENGNSILRAVHYPPGSAEAQTGSMRAAPHEDINLITLVCGETAAGLEILDRDRQWIPITTTPDEIVVDIGDMLARMTNNTLRATTHRVVARGAEGETSRYALPFFAHPRPECDLSVLEAFLAEDEKPIFPPIDAAHFLEERLREIGLL